MIRQNRPDPIKVQHLVELSQQVITGNVILKPKRIKKLILCALTSHHAGAPRCCYNGITRTLPIQEFSERSVLRVLNQSTLAPTSFSTASERLRKRTGGEIEVSQNPCRLNRSVQHHLI
jgi:hypothetical protein